MNKNKEQSASDPIEFDLMARKALSFQNSHPTHPLSIALHDAALELSSAPPADCPLLALKLHVLFQAAQLNTNL